MNLEFDETLGVLFVDPYPDFSERERLEHAKENVESSLEKAGDNLCGILAVMPHHYISAEVTRYYKNNVPNVPIAMVAHSFFQKMMGNFLLSMASPARPTKLFTSKEEGLEWLKVQSTAYKANK
jgi:hypothetical protein